MVETFSSQKQGKRCEQISKQIKNETLLSSQIFIKEEERLAAVIDEIDHDVKIAPRGAYVKTPTGQVYRNRSFEGQC